MQWAPIPGDGDTPANTPAMHHYRVRVGNQGSGEYDGSVGPPPPAKAVSISYSIRATGEDDAERQALARFEHDTGYRQPDAHVCFLAEWPDEEYCWCVTFGLADDPGLNDPGDPSTARSPLDDRTVRWLWHTEHAGQHARCW